MSSRATRIAGCMLVVLTLAGCVAVTTPSPPRSAVLPSPAINGRSTTTVASWYGPGLNGRRTSSGEVFNQRQFTAASRTLPLGTKVQVTNLKTGRSAIVRVNDRGPFVRGRGIDLSQAAAQQVGLTREGVGRVRVTRLDTTASAASEPSDQWNGNVHLRRNYRYSSSRHRYRGYRGSSKRIIRNPVGTWLLEAMR